MRPITAFSLAALLLGSANVYALTGQQFYDKCVDTYKAPEQETAREAVGRALNAGSCSGYLGGVINGVNLVGNMLGQQKIIKRTLSACRRVNKRRSYCSKHWITLKRIQKWLKYLRN